MPAGCKFCRESSICDFSDMKVLCQSPKSRHSSIAGSAETLDTKPSHCLCIASPFLLLPIAHSLNFLLWRGAGKGGGGGGWREKTVSTEGSAHFVVLWKETCLRTLLCTFKASKYPQLPPKKEAPTHNNNPKDEKPLSCCDCA